MIKSQFSGFMLGVSSLQVDSLDISLTLLNQSNINNFQRLKIEIRNCLNNETNTFLKEFADKQELFNTLSLNKHFKRASTNIKSLTNAGLEVINNRNYILSNIGSVCNIALVFYLDNPGEEYIEFEVIEIVYFETNKKKKCSKTVHDWSSRNIKHCSLKISLELFAKVEQIIFQGIRGFWNRQCHFSLMMESKFIYYVS